MRPVVILPGHGRHGITRPPPWRGNGRPSVGDTLFFGYEGRPNGGGLRLPHAEWERLRDAVPPFRPTAGPASAPVLFVGRPGVVLVVEFRVACLALGTTPAPEEAP